MQRRSYLALVGGSMPAFAGCSGSIEERPTDEPSWDTDTPTETGTHYDPPPGNIVELETIQRTYSIDQLLYRKNKLQVEFSFGRTATADHPVTVWTSIRNRGDYENTFYLESFPPFTTQTSRRPYDPGSLSPKHTEWDNGAKLVLTPSEYHELAESTPEVERDEDGLWRATEVASWLPETVRLEPRESIEGLYYLVGHPDGTGRPTGVYEFPLSGTDPLRVAVWDTEKPGPTDKSQYIGQSVPPISLDSTLSWYHYAGPANPAYVEPEVERTDLPAAISFTFVNHSRTSLQCGHWNLYKLVQGRWHHLGPRWRASVCHSIIPGSTERMTLRAFHHEGLDCGTCDCDRTMTVDHLGGGRYAMVSGYGRTTDRSGALFELDAPSIELTPTRDVTSERDGRTVTVRTGQDTDNTFEARTVGTAGTYLIPEQVMRQRVLRNTIPFLTDSVERVVLRAPQQIPRPYGLDEDNRFRLGTQAYEVRRIEEE